MLDECQLLYLSRHGYYWLLLLLVCCVLGLLESRLLLLLDRRHWLFCLGFCFRQAVALRMISAETKIALNGFAMGVVLLRVRRGLWLRRWGAALWASASWPLLGVLPLLHRKYFLYWVRWEGLAV